MVPASLNGDPAQSNEEKVGLLIKRLPAEIWLPSEWDADDDE
jgi:hypothetical protein